MIFARIILIVLCVVAAGLYVRVLLPPQQEQVAEATESTPPSETVALKPLPEDQMQIVLHTLAPEIVSSSK